jgi:hypothetical protein
MDVFEERVQTVSVKLLSGKHAKQDYQNNNGESRLGKMSYRR